jgi:lysozyme family protein
MAVLTQAFFNTILAMEGGYQNDPDDSGNYACGNQVGTNMGIAAPSYQTYTGRCPSVYDMKAIDQAFAWGFYNWYWERFNIHRIENQKLAELVMNNTMGSPANACKTEQRALIRLGYRFVMVDGVRKEVTVDGARGPITIAALNLAARQNLPRIYNAIRAEWIAYLERLNSKFLPGWMIRLNRHFPTMAAGIGIAGAAVVAGILYFALKKSR